MATTADSQFLYHTPDTFSSTPSPPLTTGNNTPTRVHSPVQSTTEAQRRRQQRHSKKLSINFPILVPARGNDTPYSQFTASPTALSTNAMSHEPSFSPPSTYIPHSTRPLSIASMMPLTPPSEEENPGPSGRARSKSRGHVRQESTSTEFLTLLASQERRVLELKEELARAESELTTLKRQWAQYEAGKKKTEAKGVPVSMGPVKSSHTRSASVAEVGTGLGLMGIEEPITEDKLEAERERRREIARERMMGRLNLGEITQPTQSNSKKTGQRVFSNSRHTRTLSLLTTATSTRSDRGDVGDNTSTGKGSLDSTCRPSVDASGSTAPTPSIPALSRTNSGLESLNLNLGRTYKELASAASRKNLPPALSPEQLVKHGKVVVDGVRDGLWTFFEDIRQATVGEEAVTGVNGGMRRQNSSRHQGTSAMPNGKLKRSMTDASAKSKSDKENEPSFWKEFGVETPKSDKLKREANDKPDTQREDQRPKLPGRWPSTQIGEDVQKACRKHDHGRVQNHAKKSKQSADLDAEPAAIVSKAKKAGREHHKSKSSTDSQRPPSLVDDLPDEDEEWDAWDSTTDPGSPRVERKKASRLSQTREDERVANREVKWHDLV